MIRPIPLLAASLLMALLVTPGWARTVRIETTVPLADHSEETISRAITEAVETVARGAAAMGLNWIRVEGARVLSDALVLHMTATDDDPGDQDGGADGRSTL